MKYSDHSSDELLLLFGYCVDEKISDFQLFAEVEMRISTRDSLASNKEFFEKELENGNAKKRALDIKEYPRSAAIPELQNYYNINYTEAVNLLDSVEISE